MTLFTFTTLHTFDHGNRCDIFYKACLNKKMLLTKNSKNKVWVAISCRAMRWIIIEIIKVAKPMKRINYLIIRKVGVMILTMNAIWTITPDWVAMTLHVRIYSKLVSFLINYCTPNVNCHKKHLQKHLPWPHLLLRCTLLVHLSAMHKRF